MLPFLKKYPKHDTTIAVPSPQIMVGLPLLAHADFALSLAIIEPNTIKSIPNKNIIII